MTGLDLLAWGVAALAANGLVEVWHHSELFRADRTRHEAGGRFVDRLLTGPFCLSVWCGWAAVLVLAAPWESCEMVGPSGGWAGQPARLFAPGLAAARAANRLNDFTVGVQRTPGRTPRGSTIGPDR